MPGQARRLCEGAVGGGSAGERFDITLAETSHLLGKIALSEGDVVSACEMLLDALNLVSRAQVAILLPTITSYFLPLTSYFLLPTSYFLPFTSYILLPTRAR